MNQYSKYTWVCTGDCDALIEYTYKDGYGWPNGVMQLTCPCGSICTLLSVEPATILPITTTKEGQTMETEITMNNLPLSDLEKYNPDLLVTYKALKDFSDAEYITDKVRNIEYELHNSRQNARIALQFQNKIASAKSIILDAYSDSDDQETLLNIAEALDIELTKEISWEATIHTSGTIQVSLTEDFDLESEINDSLYVEAQSGDIQVDLYEVANVQEAY
jgi:neutral trehalase